MYHNQKKYNCPVKFWMGLDYPSSPPICYVSPTRDMGIKPRHVHVDNAGFIYHLYLTQWNVRSSLKELCSTLTTVFSKDPPVYAKPQGGQGASHPPSQQQQSSSQPQQQVQPSSQPQPAEIRPVPQPERPPPAAAGKSHQLVQQPPSQASSRPPPNPSSAAAGVAGAVTQAAAGSWAGGVAGGWATGPSSAAGGNVEEESKDSLISFVMSKINVRCSPLHFPCARIPLIKLNLSSHAYWIVH